MATSRFTLLKLEAITEIANDLAATVAGSAEAAQTAQGLAEAARDSSFANAKGAATIAAARALVSTNDTFIVYAAGSETFAAYRKEASEPDTFLGVHPSNAAITSRFDRANRTDLALFQEDGGRTFGRVDNDGAWEIILSALRNKDGLSVEEYDRNGGALEILYVDADRRKIADLIRPVVIQNETGVTVFEYNRNGSLGVLFVDADDRIVADLLNPDSSTPVEVVNARGTADTLNARLNETLSPSGAPLDAMFNKEALRHTHWKMVGLELGDNLQLNIAAIGDSYTQNPGRYGGPLATYLVERFGDGGGGWTGYGYFNNGTPPYVIGGSQPIGVNGNARTSLYGLSFRGSWVVTYNNSPSPDLSHVTSSTPGDMIRRTVPATPNHTALRVYFIGTADGVARWRIGAGSWTSVNVQGTVGALQTFDIALGAGAQTIEMEVVSGTVSLCGDNALSNAPGVRFHKLGGSGSNVNSWWNQNSLNQIAGWAGLAPDLFMFLEAVNSQGSGISPSTWIARWSDLVDRMRDASPLADILVMGGMEVPVRNPPAHTPIADYVAQGREFAWNNGYGFLALQPHFGANKADYASDSPRPLFNTDGIHPEPATGGRLMVAAMISILLPS